MASDSLPTATDRVAALEPRHVDIIMALDGVWIEGAYRADKQAPEGVKSLPPMSQHPINAALLDVMLG